LINQVNTSTAPTYMLNQARNLNRQASFTRGIDGPLGAALENDSTDRVINAFQQQKLGNLAALLGLSNSISTGQQNVQLQQRWQEYLRKLQQAQAANSSNSALGTGIGSLIGAGGALLIPGGGPMLMPIGAQLGGSLGNLIGGNL
jgi:hypothetical protein